MLVAAFIAFTPAAFAQSPIHKPALAEEGAAPFSYFLAPSDVVGFKDCPQAFQLTYDGALNNGFGEFQILAGAQLLPVNQRIKTLYKGCYPIPEYSFKRDGATYHVRFWAAPKDLDPRENLIAFVRVSVSNPGTTPVHAGVQCRYGPRGDRNRSEMPCREWYRDKFMDLEKWKGATRSERGPVAGLNGHAVYVCDALLRGDVSRMRISDAWVSGVSNRSYPSTQFLFDLRPKETRELTFKVPFVPIAMERKSQVQALRDADADDAFKRVVAFWKGVFRRAATIEVPEQKVTDTIRACLAYMLIARDVLADGKHFMQTCNKFQYHDFYFRDGSYFCRVYDMLGLHDIAAQTVEYYMETDPQGNPTDLKRMGVDDWGQSIWALAMHFRSTGDLAFARRIYPVFAPHMRFFHDRIAEDPLGLWPKCGPYDNELLDGHYTGHSFWVLLGLREAANIAKALGKKEDCAEWTRLHDEYRARFLAQLKKMTDLTGGYIPPGIDDPAAGRDWENATGGVYPFGVLPVTDPRVAATVRTVREYKWREGISTWGTNGWVLKQAAQKGLEPDPGTLHHYQTYNTTETMLALGMQREVLEDLYSILAHTSSTHAGFELGTDPWGARDTGGNYPPHGWFAARTIELLRNMMVREDGDKLHLASALSPVWLMPGKQVRVKAAATNFGPISFTIDSKHAGASVEISAKWRHAPKSMVFHLPWFVTTYSVEVDGKPAAVVSNAIVLKPSARRLELNWVWRERPDLSYDRAVELWLRKNYNPTPGMDRNFLFPRPSRPRLAEPARQFVGSYDVHLIAPDGRGSVHFTLDGSDPTPASRTYTVPIRVTDTTTVKALTVWKDGRTSEPLSVTLKKAEFLKPAAVGEPEPGLEYEAYDWNGRILPDFAKIVPVKTGVAQAFDPIPLQPHEDYYALRFTGYLRIPRDGVYTFTTGSDDGSRLWIAGRQIVDNDGLHMYQEVVGDVPLKTGYYPLRVDFFNAEGAKYLRVFWEGPGVKKERIPFSVLFHGG